MKFYKNKNTTLAMQPAAGTTGSPACAEANSSQRDATRLLKVYGQIVSAAGDPSRRVKACWPPSLAELGRRAVPVAGWLPR